jgi:hypothetical protein
MTASDRLLPSLDLVQRVLSADAAYTISRMQVLEQLPGNPIGIAYRWMDETVVALAARFLPSFTRVIGLRSGHERHVEPLVRWYREQGLVPTFEMVPGMFDASLGRELARLGFFQSGHHACLIGDSDLASSAESQIDVERVQTREAMERYLDAYVAGWGVAEKDHAQFKTNVRPWLDQAGWSLYLARVDGQPAAAQLSISMAGLVILRTRQPIHRSADAGSSSPCSSAAFGMPRQPGSISSSAEPSRSRQATATWSESGCACNSSARNGRRSEESAPRLPAPCRGPEYAPRKGLVVERDRRLLASDRFASAPNRQSKGWKIFEPSFKIAR